MALRQGDAEAAAAVAARRVALAGRETALQRWAAALALEGARHSSSAAALADAQQQVLCCRPDFARRFEDWLPDQT